MKLKVFLSVIFSVLVVAGSTFALTMTVDEFKQLTEKETELGGFYSPDITGEINRQMTVAQTGATSSVRLLVSDSGKDILLSATGTDIVLPPVGTAGLNFKFVINGASANANFIVDSKEGDNINGTLSVNNADVACSGEDQLNFVTDGETIGDYVVLYSDGSQWIIGDSGVETAAKLTCTDPS